VGDACLRVNPYVTADGRTMNNFDSSILEPDPLGTTSTLYKDGTATGKHGKMTYRPMQRRPAVALSKRVSFDPPRRQNANDWINSLCCR
jgi:hypothetical protein